MPAGIGYGRESRAIFFGGELFASQHCEVFLSKHARLMLSNVYCRLFFFFFFRLLALLSEFAF